MKSALHENFRLFIVKVVPVPTLQGHTNKGLRQDLCVEWQSEPSSAGSAERQTTSSAALKTVTFPQRDPFCIVSFS